jgi:hypothetical protein
MNLRKYPSTAGDAVSSSSRKILSTRAPTRKSTSFRRRAVSVGILYTVKVVALAAAVGSAAAAMSLALQESSWVVLCVAKG